MTFSIRAIPNENPMSDLATVRGRFLDRVHGYEPGQSVRFAAPLDELIRWSEANGLVFHDPGAKEFVRFSVPGTGWAFWSALPRATDGAKFTLFSDPRAPEFLRATARDELARIDGRPAPPEGVPELAFTKLIWEPYRMRVLDLMARLREAVKPAALARNENAVS